ncbi:type VI secretion system protein TssA [soil metagenome]
MPAVDVEALLKPISESDPSGPDLQYDGRFMQVARDAEGKPEDQFTKTPAQEPNWREVRDGAIEVLARGRDLRMGVLLAAGETRVEGYPGLERGLRFLRGCVEQHWDSVHPRLDPEDGLDPLMRANALATLSAPVGTFGDSVRFIERVRALPLCDSRQLGRYSLEDFAIASGALPLPEGSTRAKPELKLIEAAFLETDLDQLKATLAAIEKSVEHAKAVEASFNGKVKPGQGIDWTALNKVIADAQSHVRRHVSARTGAPAGADGAALSADGAGGNRAGAGGGGGGFSISGSIGSPADATVALEAIAAYYARNEPSSPVALIVHCAKQCVGKDFTTLSDLISHDTVKIFKELASAGDAKPS